MEKRFEETGEAPFSGALKSIPLNQGIQLSEVCFRYYKDTDGWDLQDISVDIPAGTMTVIVGPSGAGKSTLADLILGLLSPDRGTVSIDGQVLNGSLLQEWRRSVGYVPQENFLFHDTIRANLLWAFPEATDEEIWSALGLAAAEGICFANATGAEHGGG